jgi:hypothetical protein
VVHERRLAVVDVRDDGDVTDLGIVCEVFHRGAK